MKKPTLKEVHKKLKMGHWSFLSINTLLNIFDWTKQEEKILIATMNVKRPVSLLARRLK